MAKKSKADAAIEELRAYGLKKYPGAHIKSPWPGHADLAVNDKTFAYLSAPGDPEPHVGCKLPSSSDVALLLPFVTPTGYGLGKSGWVNADFKDTPVPMDLMKEWLDESYRAQAPKKLVAQLDGAGGSPAPKAAAKKKAPAKAAKRAVKKKR